MSEVHVDKLGREIIVGDCVALPVGNHLHIGQVTALTPKPFAIFSQSVLHRLSRTSP